MKSLIALVCALSLALAASAPPLAGQSRRFKVRTITAGVNLKSPGDLAVIELAIGFLQRARRQFEHAGYEVQTLRIATQPLPQYLAGRWREQALADLRKLDRAVAEQNVILSIGPAMTNDRYDPEFAAWAARLVTETTNINFSVTVASTARGIHHQAARAAAEAILAIAKVTRGGEGNFRFTAAANCPAGIPFFPAAYHQGPEAFSIGLESATLVREAGEQSENVEEAKQRLRTLLDTELAPIERLALRIARSERRQYLGIDVSPAPSKDASIGAAIEAFTRVPFGSASTLSACAAITDTLHALRIKRCGYSGLMLPVLEDPVLARRAAEERYGVRELLLYSSVSGTGLDVVPLPGDTSVTSVTALIRDVAALSTKLRKPLSARLFLIPGKKAGDRVRFNNPFLTDSVIMKLD
jgi:hypothetical protein